MAHKFSLSFKKSWITRRGPNLVSKFHPGLGRQKCYEYAIRNRKSATHEDVEIAPIQYRRDKWLYGPATLLSSRQIVYPCSRSRCVVPCPCLICGKKHPRCRAGQSCGCDDCRLHFENHTSFHSCFHFGCRSCNNIVRTIPFFNYFFLDKSRKTTNKGVFVEEQLEPHFKLPPGLRRDMTSEFLIHRKWPEKLKNWECGIADDGIWCVGCSCMFFKTDMLKEHILENHNTSKVFRHNCENDEKPALRSQCDDCEKTFGSRNDLIRHVESVHYKERFECPSCDMTFSRRDYYEVHKVNKHNEAPKSCDTCGMKYKTYSNLLRHIEKRNCAKRECETCQKTFSRLSDLQRHQRETCNLEKVFVVKCDVCASTFIRTSDLVKHKKNRNYPDGSAKFMCKICNMKVCNLKLLKAHIKSKHVGLNHGIEVPKSFSGCGVSFKKGNITSNQTYECEYCGKQFAREDSVLKHAAIHNSIINKTKCEICGSEFSLGKNYKRHQLGAHDEDGNPRHNCHICEKIFCTGKMLGAHLSSYHKEEFFCTVCEKSFDYKHHYERHIINRTLVPCQECGISFCNKKGYNNHISATHIKSLHGIQVSQNSKLDKADGQLGVDHDQGHLQDGGDGPIQDDGDRHLGDAFGDLG